MIDRDTLSHNYVSLEAINVIISGKPLSCLWSLNTTLTQTIAVTASNIIETQTTKNGTLSYIDCLIPNQLITSGANIPIVSLQLKIGDLDHLTKPVLINVAPEA